MRTIAITILFLALGIFSGRAQDNKVELVIKTSAICGMCEERIEENIRFIKGVKSADLDLKTKELRVLYNPFKVTPTQIRKAVSNTGYDADDVARNEEAFNKLPGCCRSEGACTHKK